MLECDYEVKQIDGDYAHLQRIDRPEEELKLVARALLPMEIYEERKRSGRRSSPRIPEKRPRS